MKKRYGTIPLILAAALLLLSCERIFFDPPTPADAPATFDYLWNKVNEQYAYFDVKNVDWDAVYARYAPEIRSGMSDDSLFFQLGSMLNELRDGHVNLFSEFNISRFDISLLGPDNIDFRFIKENYLGTDYYSTGPFQHDFIAGGRVGYIRYASFSTGTSGSQILYLFDRYKDTDGLILDMRQNGGGYISNVNLFLSYLTLSDAPVFTSCIKAGPGHEEFSGLTPVYAVPADTVLHYAKPVAVLIDRGSYSATSMFSLATLALDNVFLVGDTTGGGLGMPNGGQLPNGWIYRFSITRTLTPDGINYENGVPPDIYAVLDSSDMAQGFDTVIEAALDSLLQR